MLHVSCCVVLKRIQKYQNSNFTAYYIPAPGKILVIFNSGKCLVLHMSEYITTDYKQLGV